MTKDYPRSEPRKGSQGYAIIKYLERGKTLTGLEALQKFGTMKLSTRIGELESAGYKIQREWFTTPSKKRVRLYYI